VGGLRLDRLHAAEQEHTEPVAAGLCAYWTHSLAIGPRGNLAEMPFDHRAMVIGNMPMRSELSQHRFGDAGRRADRQSLDPARDPDWIVCTESA